MQETSSSTKNLALAIVLCLAVLFGWSFFAEYMGWVAKPDPQVAAQQQAEAERARQEKAEAEKARTSVPLTVFAPVPGRDITISTPLYEAVIHSGGGVVRSFRLKHYSATIQPDSPLVDLVDATTAESAPLGLVIDGAASWSLGQWAVESEPQGPLSAGQSAVLRLVGEVNGLRVVRELQFSADSYLIKEKTSLTPLGDQTRSARVAYTVASDASNAGGGQYDAMRIAWYLDNSLGQESDAEDLTKGVTASGNVSWAGPMSTYFLSAILPGDTSNVTVKGLLRGGVYRVAVEEQDIQLTPGNTAELEASYWFGPKKRKLLMEVSDSLAGSVELGMFSIIAKGLLWLLEFFHQYVNNWGLAIILLTVLIKAVFWPLTAKSYASMEKMKKLQPMMMNIREKYKDNKEMMNKEVMALYKTYGVNPASGCIPILVQLPVFFGLYQALLTAIELRHATFVEFLPFTDKLWLADLSAKDPFYITPIIMGLTMFLQQRMSPPPTDPTQQKVMMFLPLIFTVLFLGFPSGLVLYWLVNNILSIAQQGLMHRKNRRLDADS